MFYVCNHESLDMDMPKFVVCCVDVFLRVIYNKYFVCCFDVSLRVGLTPPS